MNQNSREFSCFCQQKVGYDRLTEHIKICRDYQKESPFYKEFTKLPMDKLQEVHLVAIQSEFNLYQKILQENLNRVGYVPSQQQQFSSQPQQLQPQSRPQSNFRNSGSDQISNLGLSKIGILGGTGNQNLIQCQSCHKNFDQNQDMEKIWYLQQCCHIFCKICLSKQIQHEFVQNSGDIKCKECSTNLDHTEIMFIVGNEKFQKLDQQLIQVMYNLIKCINCNQQVQFEPGKVTGIKDDQGNPLSKIAEKHYAENRFTCSCKTEQCKSCQATPYHIGYTCEEYKKFKNSKHCRYCDQQIIKPNPRLPQNLSDICEQEECMGKAQHACQKTLNCGHPCYGVKGEQFCPPCFHENCAMNNEDQNQQTGDDYCNICFVEGLSAAPVMKIGCGHYFHYHCLKKRLDVKWPSARISFNFCLCPLCKSWMDFPIEDPLNTIQVKNLQLIEEIKKKSMDRLKHEERLKDEKLVNPNSAYYNKPLDYAMAIYAYYECFKCKKSYFGGHKDCQQAMDEGSKDFKASELVCANCCEIPIEDCKKHGKDFIEFKCKFCCSVSQWFCWGTTHFCDPCHKKQCAGDYVSKYPVEKLPKCPGKDRCPLKVDHKPNGQECSLGCMMCRNAKENQVAHNF